MNLICFVDQVKLFPDAIGIQLRLPVVEDAEQPQTWRKETDKRKDPPQGSNQAPQRNTTGGFGPKEAFLYSYCFKVKHYTCLQTPYG